MRKFNLRKDKNVQTYGLGVKEVWEVPPETFKAGLIQHTLGWPLQSGPFSDVFGGSFLYHMEPNLVLMGIVVGLDYTNPYTNPYREFQRWKHHPEILKHIKGGHCIQYGARVLNEGGYHSIPKLTFPGGALIGCSAGFLNSVKIKGTHTAMKSGMLAAEAMYPLLTAKGEEGTVLTNSVIDEEEKPIEATSYETALYDSWVGKELKEIRNAHGAFHGPLGTIGGMAYTALSCWVTKGNEPWTMKNAIIDADKTKKAKDCQKIDYPKPDGVVSFDLLTNLARSGDRT
jgi:electron-transferring-flavoprotein dehydrogenase